MTQANREMIAERFRNYGRRSLSHPHSSASINNVVGNSSLLLRIFLTTTSSSSNACSRSPIVFHARKERCARQATWDVGDDKMNGADEIPGIYYRKWRRWRGDRGVGWPRDLRKPAHLARRCDLSINSGDRSVLLSRSLSLSLCSSYAFLRINWGCVYAWRKTKVSWRSIGSLEQKEKTLYPFHSDSDWSIKYFETSVASNGAHSEINRLSARAQRS